MNNYLIDVNFIMKTGEILLPRLLTFVHFHVCSMYGTASPTTVNF